jgi:cell division protease FtsH
MAIEAKRPRSRFRRAKRNALGFWAGQGLVLLIAAYVGLLQYTQPHVQGNELRFDVFVELAQRGQINSARILDADGYVTGSYNAEGRAISYKVPYLKADVLRERLVDVLLTNRIPLTIDQQNAKRTASLASLVLPVLILAVLTGYLILSYRRGTGLFGIRSGARKFTSGTANLSFADVAGQDSAVAELKEIKEFLSDPRRFAALGAQVPKGVLLYGPPGCGKTLLAKALAGEAGANFYSISGSDFVELYTGVGAARVRELFREARECAPAIIFIDELDSLGRARGAAQGMESQGEQEQSLNQILAEMDGFSPSEGITVIGATNRADVLDSALLRPGRFDRTIGLELPDEKARLSILSLHAANKPLGPGVDLGVLASRAIGFTGADLASLMNEGALLAARDGRASLSQEDLDQALQRILEAPERQRRLSLRERSIARRFADHDRVTFSNVAGQDAAVTELQEIKEFLSEPARFTDLGAEVPKGVLLYGPPGCGKTLLAKALAGEANAAFFSVAASEFVGNLVGAGASRVRDLFAEARSMAPAILFIDELDSLGRSRARAGAQAEPHAEQEQALNQLLAEMDGFSAGQGLIVLGATNRPDILDPALLRPGRFDRTVALALPDEGGRLAVLSLHAESKRLAPDVDLTAVASRAIGLTGADLANLMNEGALLAARAGKPAASQVELEEALQRILTAPGEQRRLSLAGKSIGRRASGEQRATFSDLAGVDEALPELVDVKHYLTDPGRYATMGARPPRGILLSGPPGCGKTLLARAVAGEANAAFFSVAGSEFVEVFAGEGAARVRDLFGEAKSMAPSIVFIDEIDAIGGHRVASAMGGGREMDQTLNQLLVELDGFEAASAMIVMAATNRPDMLDPALVRPGRFDRQVTLTLPDRAGRRAILELHAKDKRLASDVDLDVVTGLTQGFSGADLANVLNEATLLAARRGVGPVTMSTVEEAVDRAIMGVASRTTVMSDEERRVVAYHEAGHAVVALGLPGAAVPHKLTVAPRGPSLGHCTTLDSHDQVVVSRSMLVERMTVLLGGMVAEQLVFGEPSSGASGDLDRVGETARMMVRDLGMSPQLGPLTYPDPAGSGRRARHTYSEDVARMIDTEARRLVQQAADQARALLESGRASLDRVAAALLEKETLDAEEIEAIAAVSQTRSQAQRGSRRRTGGTRARA